MRWTDEARKKQSEAIKTWKPWSSSTGPRSIEGRSIVSQNAFKHGMRTRHFIDDRKSLNELMNYL